MRDMARDHVDQAQQQQRKHQQAKDENREDRDIASDPAYRRGRRDCPPWYDSGRCRARCCPRRRSPAERSPLSARSRSGCYGHRAALSSVWRDRRSARRRGAGPTRETGRKRPGAGSDPPRAVAATTHATAAIATRAQPSAPAGAIATARMPEATMSPKISPAIPLDRVVDRLQHLEGLHRAGHHERAAELHLCAVDRKAFTARSDT